MKNIAEKLLRFEGMEEITNNPLDTNYFKKLISQNKYNGKKNRH
jgi:hypothetical protein